MNSGCFCWCSSSLHSLRCVIFVESFFDASFSVELHWHYNSSDRLRDFIQPKNCEILNSGGNIFCETLRENLKNCQCSTHWKLLAALTMTQWFHFRPLISLPTQTSSHFGTTYTYIVIIIYIKIKCCLAQPFTCKQRKSSEPFRLCLEILKVRRYERWLCGRYQAGCCLPR